MTGWPSIQATTGPAESATVLFDFSEDFLGSSVLHEGFTPGAPEPQGTGWSRREMVIPAQVQGPRPAALARHSDMCRVLLTRKFWLRFQLDATTDPVWYRVVDVQPDALSFDRVFVDRWESDAWESSARLTAEPFALGAEIALGTYTIAHDPAAATNPGRITLGPIIGDAPAPLKIAASPGGPPGMGWLWSTAPVEATDRYPVWQIGVGDGFTAGADTGAGVADAAYSGGSYRRVSFAGGTALADRISGAVSTPVLPGSYQAFVRVARTDTDSRFSLRLGVQVFGSYYILGDTYLFDRGPSPAAGHAQWVSLGEVRFPAGMPDILPTSESPGGAMTPTILLQAGRTAGAGQLDLDAIRLIPSMDLYGTWRSSTLYTNTTLLGYSGAAVWDGAQDLSWGRATPTSGLSLAMPLTQGEYPTVTPGATNTLALVPNLDNAYDFFMVGNPDSIAATVQAVISYHPRWLHLAAS